MELPAQPPPDAPAPPPGKAARRSRQKMIFLLLLGGISIAATSFVVCVRFLPKKLSADELEARNNLVLVYLELLVFDKNYGRFPDSTTATRLHVQEDGFDYLGTTSSNDLFRQIIATGRRQETIYFAASSVTPRKPNNILGIDALARGECSFAYVSGFSASDDPSTPLAMAPVIPAKRCFERRKSYNNNAVILFIDGSVRSLPINRSGQVQLNGMDLFDPRQTFWGGTVPDVKWPE
jgi:hypothetical protein